MRHFMYVFLLAQTTVGVHKHLTNNGYFDCGKKSEYPQLEPHVWIKMVQVLGSPVYICGFYTKKGGFFFGFFFGDKIFQKKFILFINLDGNL